MNEPGMQPVPGLRGRRCRTGGVRRDGNRGLRPGLRIREGELVAMATRPTAPEQIEGRPVDSRTDEYALEYALACSTFEMLTGAPPFRRDETLAIMWAQLSSQPPTVTSSRPDLPAAVDQVMARALAKDAADRYPTCLEFAAALRRACGYGTDPGMPGPGPGGAACHRLQRSGPQPAVWHQHPEREGDQPGRAYLRHRQRGQVHPERASLTPRAVAAPAITSGAWQSR